MKSVAAKSVAYPAQKRVANEPFGGSPPGVASCCATSRSKKGKKEYTSAECGTLRAIAAVEPRKRPKKPSAASWRCSTWL